MLSWPKSTNFRPHMFLASLCLVYYTVFLAFTEIPDILQTSKNTVILLFLLLIHSSRVKSNSKTVRTCEYIVDTNMKSKYFFCTDHLFFVEMHFCINMHIYISLFSLSFENIMWQCFTIHNIVI